MGSRAFTRREMTVSHDDPLNLQHTYADELEGLYAPVSPEGFPEPELLLLNRALADELGLDRAWLEVHSAKALSGSEVPAGARPIAQAYAGHQFGHFNPQLGDGRALLLGEVVDPAGRRFDLHLKGAGVTPFSRRGDGRAALDSAVREYVLSEAMHALSVPTTRALAVVTTGETVIRDRPSPGAVLTRVAASHLRVGTLELFAAREDQDAVLRLVRYALRRHYPDQAQADAPARALLESVASAQAESIARWMTIGFVHGVMNTDNFTLSGETIDYGPCAFMEAYDPDTVFSRIDHGGRYAFGHQPGIGLWNLARMTEALLPLIDEDEARALEIGQAALERYRTTFGKAFLAGMVRKIGLRDEEEKDAELVQALLDAMKKDGADYTGTFRALSAALRDEAADLGPAVAAWTEGWRARLGDASPRAVAEAMDAVNPLYIPRNHKVEEALTAALYGDLGPTRELLEVLSRPFEVQPGREAYAEPAPAGLGPYRTHCNT